MSPQEAFFLSYVGTALWSSMDDDGEPLDSNYDRDDIAAETLDAMRRDCEAFYEANQSHIHCEDAPMSREFEGPIAAREAAMALQRTMEAALRAKGILK